MMNHRTLVFLSLVLTTTLAAQHSEAQTLYAFGDSLSDTGYEFKNSVCVSPKLERYRGGRLSNGPVWVEYYAYKLGNAVAFQYVEPTTTPLTPSWPQGASAVAVVDCSQFTKVVPVEPLFNVQAFAAALSGFTTLPDSKGNTQPFGLRSQVSNFISSLGSLSLSQTDIVTVWAGANDQFQNTVDQRVVVGNITQSIKDLYNKGARRFLVLNLPNLGDTPGFRSNFIMRSLLNSRTSSFNSSLSTALRNLKLSHASIKLYDVNGLFKSIIRTPTNFGLDDTSNSCWALNAAGNDIEWTGDGNCGVYDSNSGAAFNAERILFWDPIHPSTEGHKIIADRAPTFP